MNPDAIALHFCIDCALTLEYGYLDDTTPERDEEIAAGLSRFEAGQLYMLDGDPDHMKAAPCDCCHNAGEIGDRYRFEFIPATTTTGA
jgi:hypothetical protein